MTIVCELCSKSFSVRYNLNKHLKNVHKKINQKGSVEDNGNFKCLEVGCSMSYHKSVNLIDHLQKDHHLNFETEELRFKDIDEFSLWKYSIEQKEKCYYTLSSKRNMWKKDIAYYCCNRSGKAPQRDPKKCYRRQLKSQGYCKINRACPSTIKSEQNKRGRIYVIWQKTHYGHAADMEHIRIPKLERYNIVSKLINGASVEEIIDENRNKNEENYQRIHLLNKRDILNIKRTYILNNRTDAGLSEKCTSQGNLSSINEILQEENLQQKNLLVENFQDKDLKQKNLLLEDFQDENLQDLQGKSLPAQEDGRSNDDVLRENILTTFSKLQSANIESMPQEAILQIKICLDNLNSLMDLYNVNSNNIEPAEENLNSHNLIESTQAELKIVAGNGDNDIDSSTYDQVILKYMAHDHQYE